MNNLSCRDRRIVEDGLRRTNSARHVLEYLHVSRPIGNVEYGEVSGSESMMN